VVSDVWDFATPLYQLISHYDPDFTTVLDFRQCGFYRRLHHLCIKSRPLELSVEFLTDTLYSFANGFFKFGLDRPDGAYRDLHLFLARTYSGPRLFLAGASFWPTSGWHAFIPLLLLGRFLAFSAYP
jgi:hypothetical protein